MLQNLSGWHAVIIIAVILLVFGAAKLPALARSAGQSVRILRSEMEQGRRESPAAGAAPVAPAAPAEEGADADPRSPGSP